MLAPATPKPPVVRMDSNCHCWALNRKKITNTLLKKAAVAGSSQPHLRIACSCAKPQAVSPHKGGVRIERHRPEYALLVNWIKQGAIYDGPSAAALSSIEVHPDRGLMKPGSHEQLKAIAKYSDGSQRDVTELALFESNDKAMAEVTASGVVSTANIPGKVAIMVRYQGKTAVFNAAIPLGAAVAELPAQKKLY